MSDARQAGSALTRAIHTADDVPQHQPAVLITRGALHQVVGADKLLLKEDAFTSSIPPLVSFPKYSGAALPHSDYTFIGSMYLKAHWAHLNARPPCWPALACAQHHDALDP